MTEPNKFNVLHLFNQLHHAVSLFACAISLVANVDLLVAPPFMLLFLIEPFVIFLAVFSLSFMI